MSDKPKATRSSTRNKTPATNATTAAPTRTTRARAAAATATATPPSLPAPPSKKPAGRKPLLNRANTEEVAQPPSKPSSRSATARQPTKTANAVEIEHEPIMAYLRIRPNVNEDDEASSPYLTQLSDRSVRMSDPQEHQNLASRFRASTVTPSSTYTFSHVFPPNTTQSDFFYKTTLPLVRDVLEGQNALLFTYGVTNSGKTYTVQGGSSEGSAGILPRSLDVIFNSIEGLHGDGRYRPVRLYGVEPADESDLKPPPVTPEPAIAEVLGSQMNLTSDMDADSTTLKLDRNHEYTIWLSYAEVYNEKVYDLLGSVKDDSGVQPKASGIPRLGNQSPLVIQRNALPLKASPASDNPDSDVAGKYIAGLRQFRVQSASQAKALVKLGQLHRRVFGTLANRESSRSHGMVILKIMRYHRGERNDPTAIQVSRLTLVDLAGSERTKHTHTTGDRLKEAGNINKSLMVLGQCLEVLRSNQRKVATSLSHEGEGKAGRMDTRDVKKALSIVPFRHSKLTEALMDYFAGDGRAVMIVNVNPYDTGYDENSHVMKFAALAREVYVSPTPAPVQRAPIIGKLQGKTIKQLGPATLKDPDIAPKPFRRKVTISMDGPGSGRKPSEAVLEVLEVPEDDEGNRDDQDSDSPINPLVDALFDEVEYLRLQLYESEMRSALVEAEVREEVTREMEERMRNMEQMYTRRLMNEIEQNEMKTDAKIDMLHQSGLFGSPVKRGQARPHDYSSEEEEVESSLIDEEDETESSGEEFDFGREEPKSSNASPLAGKAKSSAKPSSTKRESNVREVRESRPFIPDGPMLPSDCDEAETTENETEMDDDGTSVLPSESESEEDAYHDSEEEEEWVPTVPTPKAKSVPRVPGPSTTRQKVPQPRFLTSKNRVSALEQGVEGMSIADDDHFEDNSLTFSPKKSRSSRGSGPRKMKRLLGSTPIVREEQIEQAALAVDKRVAQSGGGKNIKRFVD